MSIISAPLPENVRCELSGSYERYIYMCTVPCGSCKLSLYSSPRCPVCQSEERLIIHPGRMHHICNTCGAMLRFCGENVQEVAITDEAKLYMISADTKDDII